MFPTLGWLYADPGAMAVSTWVAAGASIREEATGSPPASAANVCTAVIMSGPCMVTSKHFTIGAC